MERAVTKRTRWVRVLALGAVLGAACGDDDVAVSDSASGTESSTGTTGPSPTTTNSTPPTTTDPTTDATTSDATTDSPPTTTDPTTETTSPVTTTETTDTTIGTTDTTIGTTDTTAGTTDTTTDTTTGAEVVGKSVTQTVNGGTVATSTNFRMVFTLGQPTQNQGVYNSTNFRLQGGLIGANGNPP